MNTFRHNPSSPENEAAMRENDRYIGGLQLQHAAEQSDTPRTDKAVGDYWIGGNWSDAFSEFTKDLERELTRSRDANREAIAELNRMHPPELCLLTPDNCSTIAVIRKLEMALGVNLTGEMK